MGGLNHVQAWIRQRVGEVVGDDEKRFRLQLIWVYRIIAVTALAMALINTITGELSFVLPTVVFGVACVICSVLIERHQRWKWRLVATLMAVVTVYFGYLIMTGGPDGFSPTWICIVPPVTLLMLGRRQGGGTCLILFLLLVFLMWTPWGRGMLQYAYSNEYLLRLPLVYTAAFWVSWFLEYVREATRKKLDDTQRSLEHLYRHDALTGVMNRYGFNEHIAQAVNEHHPEGLALMIVDLDDFKQTNDRYGHQAGDVVLRQCAETIENLMREHGQVSRWGGEEFAVLLNRAENAQAEAERVRLAVESMQATHGGVVVPVTVSIGLTVCAADEPIDAERLLTLTDQSLYYAKIHGKNQVATCGYTPSAA